MIQHHLQLSYSDCLSVLTELYRSNELEPLGFLWKVNESNISCKKRKTQSIKLEAIQENK